jgi:nucleoid-associated protein YgaU
MNRYTRATQIRNVGSYYRELRRGRRRIIHYDVLEMKNPTMQERVNLKTTTHIWKYGDRLYKLADQYYGDPEYWWVIAWYNMTPTEVALKTGQVIRIPLSLTAALSALGV